MSDREEPDYTAEQKDEAVCRAQATGAIKEVARDLKISASTLVRWMCEKEERERYKAKMRALYQKAALNSLLLPE